MSDNIVKWGTYEPDEAAREAEELEKTGTAFYKFLVGKNVLRFLPPALGRKSPFMMVWQHAFTVNGETRSAPCPRLMAKLPCPVCTKGDQLKGSTNPADQERAKDFWAKRRVFANVIDRQHPENGPIVAAFGKKIWEALVALRSDPDAGGDFTHPVEGFDIVIERKGTGQNDTTYQVLAARNSTPLGDLSWIEQQVSLEPYAKVLSPEEMRARLSGKKVERSQAAAPAAQPARTQTVTGTATKPTRTPPARTVEQDTVGVEVDYSEEDVPF
jgi:hypothetical protein